MEDTELIANLLQMLYFQCPEINEIVDMADLLHLHHEDCKFNSFTLTEFLNFVQPWIELCENIMSCKTENGITRIGFCEELDVERFQHVHYFDEQSGEHLGITKEKAANKCKEKGEVLMVQENYELAAEWFDKSYFLCENGCELEHIYLDNKDAANFAMQAVKLKNEGKLSEALDQYQNAMANCHIMEMNSRFDNEIKALQNEINEEEKKFSQLWEEAWNAEENDELEKASIILNTLLEDCKNYKEWNNIVSLKISGNNEFNSGIEEQLLGCQILDQANSEQNYIKKKEHFEMALNHFKNSKTCFLDGFNIQNDPRFNECVCVAQESIEKLENSIFNLKANEINDNIQNEVKVTCIKEKGVPIMSRQLAIPNLGSGIN